MGSPAVYRRLSSGTGSTLESGGRSGSTRLGLHIATQAKYFAEVDNQVREKVQELQKALRLVNYHHDFSSEGPG